MKVNKTRKIRKKAVLAIALSLLFFFALGLSLKLKNAYPKELLSVDKESKQIGELKSIKEKNKNYYKVFYLPKIKNKEADAWVRKISEENENLIHKNNKENEQRIAYKQDYESYEVDGMQSIAIHLFKDGEEIKTDMITLDEQGQKMDVSKLFKPKAKRYLTHMIRENNPKDDKSDRSTYLSDNHIERFTDFFLKEDGILFFFDKGEYFFDFASHQHFLKEDFAGFQAADGDIPSVYLDRGVKKEQKLVAFTFDDGPHHENTVKLMDALEEYNGQGTFFMVGQRVEGQEEIVKEALDRGHQVANHSFSHQNFNAIPQSEVKKEIDRTNEAFEKASGYPGPYMIRPPYGNANETVLKNNPHVFVNWSVDTLDWQSHDPKAICQSIEHSAHDGAIILLHDLYESSYEGFRCGIQKLHDAGYEFVTVEELLKAKEINIKENNLYFDAT